MDTIIMVYYNLDGMFDYLCEQELPKNKHVDVVCYNNNFPIKNNIYLNDSTCAKLELLIINFLKE